jgi:hypothetical protein
MQFQLPQELQHELLAYDPQLKALVKPKQPGPAKKKAPYTLGQPKGIIPDDVIREALLNEAITKINSAHVNYRFQKFTRVVDVATPTADVITIAILYHYENIWYAAWLPPKGKEDEYVYGYSYWFKDTVAARKSMPYYIKTDMVNAQQIKIGRSDWFTRTVLVTKERVQTVDSTPRWNIPDVARYYKKGQQLRPAINTFEAALRNSIPTWKDGNGILDRIKSSSLIHALFTNVDLQTDYFNSLDHASWQPSFQSIQQLIVAHKDDFNVYANAWRVRNKIMHIIDTPFLRRWIQAKCNAVIELHQDEDNQYLKNVKRPFAEILRLFEAIAWVNAIWPDCPLDYYQNNIDALISVDLWSPSKFVKNWLRTNMPIATFFHLINKFYDEKIQDMIHVEVRRRHENLDGVLTFRFYALNDTFSMIHSLHEAEADIPTPKRWRIDEFHDIMQAETWKIKNKNESLPQDLFPAPVKIELGNKKWTFFQPNDTHQLAQWGQAVRNCVGAASGYAEGVKKKQHFIVLCMIDNKPVFTVQLEVRMGMMSVKQITGLSNKSLTLEEKELYTTAFGNALKQRNKQLS